jgi:hypothetical protein
MQALRRGTSPTGTAGKSGFDENVFHPGNDATVKTNTKTYYLRRSL